MTLENDPQKGKPLLVPFMRQGKRVNPATPLSDLRAHAAKELSALPNALKELEPAPPFQVKIAPALQKLTDEMDAALRK